MHFQTLIVHLIKCPVHLLFEQSSICAYHGIYFCLVRQPHPRRNYHILQSLIFKILPIHAETLPMTLSILTVSSCQTGTDPAITHCKSYL